jgi:hypothetical protein
MSIYDDNELLKDMLLVSEAMEEVDESIHDVISYNTSQPRRYTKKFDSADTKHAVSRQKKKDIHDDQWSNMLDYRGKLRDKWDAAEVRGPGKYRQQNMDRIAKKAHSTVTWERKKDKQGQSSYDIPANRRKYFKSTESFEDIYNSIL